LTAFFGVAAVAHEDDLEVCGLVVLEVLYGALVLLSLERADGRQAVFDRLDDAGLLVLGGEELAAVSIASFGATVSIFPLTLYGKNPWVLEIPVSGPPCFSASCFIASSITSGV